MTKDQECNKERTRMEQGKEAFRLREKQIMDREMQLQQENVRLRNELRWLRQSFRKQRVGT